MTQREFGTLTHTTTTPAGGSEVTPVDLLYRLWRRKVWALAMIALCVLTSWFYLQRAPRQYEIRANLLLQPGAHGLRVGEMHNGRPDAELIATHSEILSSRKLLTQAVESYRASAEVELEAADPPQLPPELLVEQLSEQLTVKRVVGTRVLNVALRWGDREQGKALVEHLFECYQSLLFDLNQGGQVEALSTLAATERELRAELTELQQQYRTLRESSPLVGDIDAGLTPQQTLIDELSASYAEVRSRRIGLENRLAALDDERSGQHVARRPRLQDGSTELVSTASLTTISDEDQAAETGWAALQMLSDIDLKGLQDPVAIQQELFQAEVRRQELIKKYRGKHPDLQAVENQIADWKARLQVLADRAPLTMERELRAAKLQEEHLHQLYEQELAEAKQLDQHRLEQIHLRAQMEQVQTLHGSILSQLTDLRLNNKVTTEGGADLRVMVLDEAMASLKPVWPNNKLVLGGGLLIGLVGSSVLTLIPVPRPDSPSAASPSDTSSTDGSAANDQGGEPCTA
ncbi:GumC family protein [Roseimaritima ulvae]|nr:Wzz/FepE/Etk N-terminal domain-containing protein [Roseimaritima ulvae]